MTDYDDLIQRLLSEANDTKYMLGHASSLHTAAAGAIKELVAERDAWKEDAADRDDIEGALEQSEKSRQDWRERAEKAEADLATARNAIRWLTTRSNDPASDGVLIAIAAIMAEVEDMRDMKWQRDAAEDRAEKAEADLAAARAALRWADSVLGNPVPADHATAFAAAWAEGGKND